jgi:HEPN domain-containing protein
MSEPNKNIHLWIEKADHDLGSAKIIYLHLPQYFDTIAFHCQQAVEKYLKAILVHLEIEFLKSHNLVYLLDLLSKKMVIEENIYDKAIQINSFGVQIRYPNEIIHLSKEELESAIEIADGFKDFAVKTIGIEEN